MLSIHANLLGKVNIYDKEKGTWTGKNTYRGKSTWRGRCARKVRSTWRQKHM